MLDPPTLPFRLALTSSTEEGDRVVNEGVPCMTREEGKNASASADRFHSFPLVMASRLAWMSMLLVSVWAATSWDQCEDIPTLPSTCVTINSRVNALVSEMWRET